MRNTILGLFAAATLFAGTVRAADSSSLSQERAAAYQSAVRTALTERGWRVTYDKAGKLVAERPTTQSEDGAREFVVGPGLDKRVQLRINFGLDNQGEVTTAAFTSVRYYSRNDPYLVGQSPFQSFPYRSPKLTQEYLDLMAAAKASATAHCGSHVDGGNQDRVALK